MLGKVFAIVVIVIAVLMALLSSLLPLDRLHDFILLLRFFESMIPILAVGALIKYICGCNHK